MSRTARDRARERERESEHLRRLRHHVRVIEARQAARRAASPSPTTETHEQE